MGLAVLAGSETRQHAYVALTRGTHHNTAYLFTTPTKLADPAPGTRPAPELARYDHLNLGTSDPGGPDDLGTTRPADVLAHIIAERDSALESASQARQRSLADADHLAVLHAIWAEHTEPARQHRYRTLLQAALPAGTGLVPGHREQWLYRTLRAAELAGLDPAQVLTQAIAEQTLSGTRDPAAVIDSRIRRRLDLTPRPAALWTAHVPETGDPDRDRFLAQLAAAMDDRARRIGEHAAASSFPWAVGALGPVPGDPDARMAWQDKAAAIGTWRELSGHAHPDDPIGPEPTASTPDLRAAWHAARGALTPDGAREAHQMTSAANGRDLESRPLALAEMSRRIEEVAAQHAEIAGRLAERHSTPAPTEDPGPAFPLTAAHGRTAILQPPKPEIPASPRILERLADPDLDYEAGG